MDARTPGARGLAGPAERSRSPEHRSGARRAPRQGRGRRPVHRRAREEERIERLARVNGSNGSNGSHEIQGSSGHGRVDEGAHVARRHRRQGRASRSVRSSWRRTTPARWGSTRSSARSISNDGPEAVINGKRVTMFGSNNYLGSDHAPQGARSRQGRHRSLRHQHDRLAPGERLDEAARGVRGEARGAGSARRARWCSPPATR